jgi:hypothetical protein
MKVIVSFIEDNGNPDYPITRHIFPIPDARTVHVIPVNNGFSYNTIIVNVPRPAPKNKVKKEVWVHPQHIFECKPTSEYIPLVYKVEE